MLNTENFMLSSPNMTTEKLCLTADSGSTKTDWLLQKNDKTIARCTTQGMNPFMIGQTEIEAILRNELLNDERFAAATQISFYGAGCRGEGCDTMERALRAVWPEAESVTVGSDLLGAARALCGTGDGIACILGTGSNSGLYVGGELVKNVSPLGYILGDEGSGAVLGRRLLGDVLKQQLPQELCRAFDATYGLSADQIIQRVYREPLANRFLASFAPFLAAHREHPAIQALLADEFARFFERNILQYERPDLEVHFVGSIAYYFARELRTAAAQCGLTVGRILKAPLDAE